jgi:hypothetical protein
MANTWSPRTVSSVAFAIALNSNAASSAATDQSRARTGRASL